MQQLTAHHPSDTLPVSAWATILDKTPFAIRKRLKTAGEIPRAVLPADWQEQISDLIVQHSVANCRDLIHAVRMDRPAWTPPRPFATYPPATQERANAKREVLRVYYAALESSGKIQNAENAGIKALVQLFPSRAASKPSSLARSLRRWISDIEERGGFNNARPEAFCDEKSCPHENARLVKKIPHALIEEFRDRCNKMPTISNAFRSLEIDWMMGREVPGLGFRPNPDAPFPFKYAQFQRNFATSHAARVLGHMGKARARARVLPFISTTTERLRPAEIYMLDDTRLDIVALDDLTGRPVELKSYIMIDLASRRIVGWTIVEGSIKSRHVEALVARVLRSNGIGRHYPTTIIFERGTVACSPARQTYLESCFPGRLTIGRTGIDGGKNHGGDFAQASSGHWMGKGHMESLVRTFIFFLGNAPGQRGNKYENQPAALGLQGRNRSTGALEYTRGSRMHDASLLAAAGRAIEHIDGTLDARIQSYQTDRCRKVTERLKFDSLQPVSWVLANITEAIAYYNQRTDHRIEGFRRIEYQNEQGGLRSRMESPNERAAWLAGQYPVDRLAAADAAAIIRTSARNVTVTRQGVSFDLDKTKFRFFAPESLAINEALRLTTSAKTYVALYDREGLLQGTSSEIHLLTETDPIPPGSEVAWKDAPARLLESLPLHERADRRSPEELAAEAQKVKRVEQRLAAQLVRDAAPTLAQRITNAQANIADLREARETTVTSVSTTDDIVHSEIKIPSRSSQRAEAEQSFAESLPLNETSEY